MEETLKLKPGDVIKGAVWFGVVRDVFVSPTSGDSVLEVTFVKNAMMRGSCDIVKLSQVAGSIRMATRDELKAHMEAERADADKRCAELLREAWEQW